MFSTTPAKWHFFLIRARIFPRLGFRSDARLRGSVTRGVSGEKRSAGPAGGRQRRPRERLPKAQGAADNSDFTRLGRGGREENHCSGFFLKLTETGFSRNSTHPYCGRRKSISHNLETMAETIVGWHLEGNQHIPGFLNGGAKGFRLSALLVSEVAPWSKQQSRRGPCKAWPWSH